MLPQGDTDLGDGINRDTSIRKRLNDIIQIHTHTYGIAN